MQEKTPADLLEALKLLQGPTGGDIDLKECRYAIYARKSTDNEERQVKSLPDQVLECQQFAEDLELKIHPDYIIQEAESAKEPGIRPRFKSLIQAIESDKVDGIIAWHPDRLSRNMKEAGEIIDLLDKKIIKDLKFKSFTFENNTSGKMLLGIAFVISKQYSDKLSDDVKRGVKNRIKEGKCLNVAKHGYYKDKNRFQWPDGDNYQLIKRAFQMRLQNKTLEEIAEYLNSNDYHRTRRRDDKTVHEKTVMDKKNLSLILRDTFYCGVLKYGETIVDLTEIYDFTPLITVDEFLEINKLSSIDKALKLSKKARSKGNIKADLMRDMVICAKCGETLQAGITNKPKANKKYFYYRCDNTGCERYGKSVRAKVIMEFVYDYLEKNNLANKKVYKAYVKQMEKFVEEKRLELSSSIRSLGQRQNNLKQKLEKYRDFLAGCGNDEEVRASFMKELKQKEAELKVIEKELADKKTLYTNTKSVIVDYNVFLELYNNLANSIKEIADMRVLDTVIRQIFLNFTVEGEKMANYTLNSPFGELEKTANVATGRGDTT